LKLYYTNASPYVRKATVTAIEAGVDSEIERIEPTVSVWVGEGDLDVARDNPLGKVPTLVTREGVSLTDSSLICETYRASHRIRAWCR
jgi:glutathione S-transferase